MKKKKNNPKSETRLRLLSAASLLNDLFSDILKSAAITKGTVYDHKRKCGNKKCKCARGYLHSSKALSCSHRGKTQLIGLAKYPIIELERIEKQVHDYKHFRRTRAKIVSCFNSLLAELNKFEQQITVEPPNNKGGSIGKRKK